MTITFENDNDIIIYTLEKIGSYASKTQHIFVAQCVWLLASKIGLEQGLIGYIDNIHSRIEISNPTHQNNKNCSSGYQGVSAIPRKLTDGPQAEENLDCTDSLTKSSDNTRNLGPS